MGDAANPFIQEFIVYPNPSDGQFTVRVVLSEVSAMAIRMFDLATGKIISEKNEIGSDNYLLEYSVSSGAGLYFLVLETPKGDGVRKIIIE